MWRLATLHTEKEEPIPPDPEQIGHFPSLPRGKFSDSNASPRHRHESETPITPVIVGDAALAHQLSRELFDGGVLATGIGFPTVPKGKARVRTIVASTHTKAELDTALEVFRKVGKKLGILGAGAA